ncbi:hypothetical protein B0T19DRAFT_152406 [Cercophora scortea]|uniref:Ankyrin n=1 Tax=Cercophora scortea TaxID=314031 RepID=A0AAE0IL12_9PEZI|nr:hypothetical protein B0T19DRAFT_152406 [Cercophora scortea]
MMHGRIQSFESTLLQVVLSGHGKTETSLDRVLTAIRDLSNNNTNTLAPFPQKHTLSSKDTATFNIPPRGSCGSYDNNRISSLQEINTDPIPTNPYNKILVRRSWTFGVNTTTTTDSDSPHQQHPHATDLATHPGPFTAKIHTRSRRFQRTIHAKARWLLKLKLLGCGSVLIELAVAVRLRTDAWMPSVQRSLRVVNVRPWDSAVYRAVRRGDVEAVRGLIECGEAGVNDLFVGDGKDDGKEGGEGEGCVSLLYVVAQLEIESQRRPLMRYLLARGSDPNLQGTTESPLRLMLFKSDVESARLLLRAGLDIYSEPADRQLRPYGESVLRAGVDLLSAEGFTGWDAPCTYHGQCLLSKACWAGSLEFVMKGLDIYRLAPGPRAVRNAVSWDRVEILAVLLEVGADIDRPPVDMVTLTTREHAHNITGALYGFAKTIAPAAFHYLLFRGIDVGANEICHAAPWDLFWAETVPTLGVWNFQELEGLLLHFLLHDGWDLDARFELGGVEVEKRDGLDVVGTMEAARLWSCYYKPEEHDGVYAVGEERSLGSYWTSRGMVVKPAVGEGRRRRGEGPGVGPFSDEFVHGKAHGVAGFQCRDPSCCHGGEDDIRHHDTNGTTIHPQDPSQPYTFYQSASSHDYNESNNQPETPFDQTTLFYQTIATPQGRRQISTFPMARALCNALQLAGYRADMDDEGDIWFDADDDGQRYHDAREVQPENDEDDGLVANCRICQDPEAHGLGYVLRRAEYGLRYMEAFRRKREERERENGAGWKWNECVW